MDFDYKKYSLGKLEEWIHDAISCDEATPQEIYDVIKNVVSENYYTYKNQTERCYELLALLNGNGKGHIQAYDKLVCDKNDPSPECQGAWNSFWEDNSQDDVYNNVFDSRREDKVVKWQLPVEVDGLTGECYIQLPDDLLEAANLKEGDQIEWVDSGNGSYLFRKVNA